MALTHQPRQRRPAGQNAPALVERLVGRQRPRINSACVGHGTRAPSAPTASASRRPSSARPRRDRLVVIRAEPRDLLRRPTGATAGPAGERRDLPLHPLRRDRTPRAAKLLRDRLVVIGPEQCDLLCGPSGALRCPPVRRTQTDSLGSPRLRVEFVGGPLFRLDRVGPNCAATRIARSLPVVVARPPTSNALRHRHTTPALTPKWCPRAAALSVLIALTSSSHTHRPEPPRCSSGCTRGHGIGALERDVILHSQSRNRQVTRSPTRTAGVV